jgi:hypothetical protein
MRALSLELTPILTQKNQDLDSIDQVLSAPDFQEYLRRYKQFLADFKQRGYINQRSKKWESLFDHFSFKPVTSDSRRAILCNIISDYQSTDHSTREEPNFFQIFTFAIRSIHHNKTTDLPICHNLRQLIAAQKNSLHHRQSFTKHSNHRSSSPYFIKQSPSKKKEVPNRVYQRGTCGTHNLLALVGLGLISINVVLNLNPKFALLLGIHLSPAMFVVLVAVGACMVGYGVSRKEPDADNSRINYYLRCCFRFGQSSSNTPNTEPATQPNSSRINNPPL